MNTFRSKPKSKKKEMGPNWPEWLKSIGIAITPIVVLWVSNNYNQALKERELAIRYVELAISVLRDPPSKDTDGLRAWAISVVDKQSGTPLSSDAQTDLRAAPLPGVESSLLNIIEKDPILRLELLRNSLEVLEEQRKKLEAVQKFLDQHRQP